MLTPAEKIKICATCRNRKRTIQKGIVCGLTEEKPQFEETCESYVADETELAARKAREELNQDDWQGPSDSDGLLEGAGWFILIAGLSLANTLLLFLGWHFLAGNSTTEILQVAAFVDIINPVLGYGVMAMIIAFYFLTWYLAAKKGSRYCYILGYSVYLIDTAVLLYESFAFGFDLNIWVIINLVFRAAVLLFGFKILDLRQAKSIEVFKNKVSKLLYTALAAVCALFSVYSFVIIGNVAQAEQQQVKAEADLMEQQEIREIVNQQNKYLPLNLGDGLEWKKAEVKDKIVVYDYMYNDLHVDELDLTLVELGIEEEKKLVLQDLATGYYSDPGTQRLLDLVISQRYAIQYSFNDCDSQFIYAVTLTASELQQAL